MLFDKFTERGKKVVLRAKESSKELKHGYIGTEHILIGLLKEGGQSKELLIRYGITEKKVLELIKKFLGVGEIEYNQDEIPVTPRVKSILEDASYEAKSMGQNYAAPEHILLSMLKNNDSLGFIIISKLFNGNIKTLIEMITEDIKKNYYQQNINQDKLDRKYNRDKRNDTPSLDMYGVDLTCMAEDEKLDPVIGRDDETQRLLEICRLVPTAIPHLPNRYCFCIILHILSINLLFECNMKNHFHESYHNNQFCNNFYSLRQNRCKNHYFLWRILFCLSLSKRKNNYDLQSPF